MSKKLEQLGEAIKQIVDVPVQIITAIVTEVDENNYTCTVTDPQDNELIDVQLRANIIDFETDEDKRGAVTIPAIGSNVLVGKVGNSNERLYIAQCSVVDKVLYLGDTTKLNINNETIDVEVGESKLNINNETIDVEVGESKLNINNETIDVKVGESTLNIKDETIDVKVGESTLNIKDKLFTFNGGKNGELINIDDLTIKLNNLVSEVNAIKDEYDSHTHTIPAKTPITTSAGSGTITSKVTTSKTSKPVTDDASSFSKENYKDGKITH